jgi:hypothetical protein
MRKAIQIAVLPGNKHFNPLIWALCDDGSLWRAAFERDDSCCLYKWVREIIPPTDDPPKE